MSLLSDASDRLNNTERKMGQGRDEIDVAWVQRQEFRLLDSVEEHNVPRLRNLADG